MDALVQAACGCRCPSDQIVFPEDNPGVGFHRTETSWLKAAAASLEEREQILRLTSPGDGFNVQGC